MFQQKYFTHSLCFKQQCFAWFMILLFSASNGMSTATTSQPVPVTKRFDYGMCRVESVSVFLLVTGVWFCPWQCLLMVAIWHPGMKMAQSWCGTFLVAVVSHLWLVTHHVSGHSLSGDLPSQSKYSNFIHVETKGLFVLASMALY